LERVVTTPAVDTPTRTFLPDTNTVARRAVEILDVIEADADYPRFGHATLAHVDYATFTGFPIVANFDLERDGPALFVEAMRVMALKAAVYELTRDEQRAELLVPAPVDEMIHAAVAQFTLLARIQARTGVDLVHAPDLKRFDYDTRCYTDLAYEAAGWGTPNPRYWIGKRRRPADSACCGRTTRPSASSTSAAATSTTSRPPATYPAAPRPSRSASTTTAARTAPPPRPRRLRRAAGRHPGRHAGSPRRTMPSGRRVVRHAARFVVRKHASRGGARPASTGVDTYPRPGPALPAMRAAHISRRADGVVALRDSAGPT
jgi:hypothetical protein